MIALAEAGLIWYLNKKWGEVVKDNKELMQKRVDDADKYAANFISVSRETVEAAKDTNANLSALKEAVNGLASGFQRLLEKK